MTNFPWFPLYVFDWQTDEKVRLMGPIARAYYFDLLCREWIDGSIPVDREDVVELLRMPDDPVDEPLQGFLLDRQTRGVDYDAVLDQVLACFVPRPSDGRLINPKLERVRIEQAAKVEEMKLDSAKLGRIGGSRKSELKANAARENGRRGGRPRKTQETQQNPSEKNPWVSDAANKGDKPKQIQSQSQNKKREATLAQRTSRNSELPTDFAPKETHRLLAKEKGLNLDEVFAKFCDHHVSKGSRFKDWDRALNTWLRREDDFRKSPRSAAPIPSSTTDIFTDNPATRAQAQMAGAR